MFAENPLYSKKSSDLNSIFILFVEIDMLFLFQLLIIAIELGPLSGPVKCATSVGFILESISFIDI